MKRKIVGILVTILLISIIVLPAEGIGNESKVNEQNLQGSFENKLCIFFARIEGPVDTDRFHLPGGTNVPLVYDHLKWENIPGSCISIGSWGTYNMKGILTTGKTDFTIGFVLPTILEPGYFLFGFTTYMLVQWS